MAHRINPETGVIEEDGNFPIFDFWKPVENEDGNRERVNPSTGVIEEEGFLGLFWNPKEPADDE